MRRPIPSSPHRPACRASLSLFPVLLLLLPQSESAIAGARSRAGKVRNTFSAFSPSGAIKRPETPMQQPPTEIRDRLLTGLDQDYNVSSAACPARHPRSVGQGAVGGLAEAAAGRGTVPGNPEGPSRPLRVPESVPGRPRGPLEAARPRCPRVFFRCYKFLVQSVRVCSPCPLSSRLLLGPAGGRDERRGRRRLDQSEERSADDGDKGGGGGDGSPLWLRRRPPSLPRRIRTLPSTGCAVRRGRRRWRRQSAITWSWCPGRTDGCGNLFAPPPCPENTGGGGEGDVRSQIDKASSARHRRRCRRARLLCNTPAKGEGGRRNERAHATATAAAAGLPRPCAITAAAAAASHSQRGKEGGPCNNSATENIPNSRLH